MYGDLGFLQNQVHAFMSQFYNSYFVPKRPGADNIQDFRPISCLNTLYKVISRILADRLKYTLPDLVLPNQTGFIKNRLLLENVLLASEVLNGYHKKNRSPRITLKIDISKVFDSVRWDFLLQTLKVMQFPSDFVDCIRACITTPSFSLSINGVTSGFFKGKSGLRQGDPISPLLFTVVMNVLSFMLNRGAEDRIFGYHPGCAGTRLTHLAFADDIMVFFDGEKQSLDHIAQTFEAFSRWSGLTMNKTKTELSAAGLNL